VKTRFIVVRHGETEWNVATRVQGHHDSPLTTKGVAQAEAIAVRLAGERFDALVASDLGRAHRTAERIGQETGHAVVADARLRERSFGDAEGLTYAELDVRWPGVFSRVAEIDPDAAIPNGESRRQFHQRVQHAFEALAREHRGQRIAVVAHGGVLAALYRIIHDIPVSRPHPIPIANASYNAMSFAAEAWQLETWDDVAHLTGVVPFVES
jgi:probable phosphoglycerate mutase